MTTLRWLTSVILVFTLVGFTGGCKGSKSKKGLGRDANVGGIGSTGIYEEELSDRPDIQGEYDSRFQSVYFDYDSSQVAPAERSKIEEVAEELQRNDAYGVIVEGHCDERGSREYNLALGERRALAVRAYLIGLGIDGSRIQTKSYGEEDPAEFGHDEESWRLNRRSEFVLFQ